MAASLVLIMALALWIFHSRPTQDRGAVPADWSIVFVVGVIFSPVCWKLYLVVLLLPNMLLFQASRSSRLRKHARRTTGTVLLVSFVLGGLTPATLIGKTLADMLQMWSIVTISTLILLGGLLWFRARACLERSENS